MPNQLDDSEPPYNDGAVLDMTTGLWRAMAASPLAGGSSSGAALDGQAIFVDATGSSAGYDPTTDTWAQIEGLAAGLNQIIQWDGTLVGTDGSGVVQLADGWLAMAPPGPGVQGGVLVAVGDDLMFFGDGSGPCSRYADGGWTALPDAPPIDFTGGMFGVGDQLALRRPDRLRPAHRRPAHRRWRLGHHWRPGGSAADADRGGFRHRRSRCDTHRLQCSSIEQSDLHPSVGQRLHADRRCRLRAPTHHGRCGDCCSVGARLGHMGQHSGQRQPAVQQQRRIPAGVLDVGVGRRADGGGGRDRRDRGPRNCPPPRRWTI